MVEFDLIAHTNDSTYVRDFRRVSHSPESRATGLYILMCADLDPLLFNS